MKNKGRNTVVSFISNVVLGVLMGISMCAIGVSMLLATMRSEMWHLYIIFPAVLLEYFILTAAHEAGHLVFGLISGYSFSSYRIGGLMWIKLPEGIKLRRFSLAGTGGQCLMTPPEAKEGKIPVFLYNLGGVIVNIIFTVILIALYLLVRGMPILPYIFVMGAEFSFIMAAFNGFPIKVGGISNDGMNAFSLRKDKDANAAFRLQLLINAEQAKGVRISQMPMEWFMLPEGADMNNPLCATIPAFYCNRLMDAEMFDEAEKKILEVIDGQNGLIDMYRGMLISDLIYCLLLKGEIARAAEYYTKEQKAFMNTMKSMPSILRSEYALAICRVEGARDGQQIKKRYNSVAKKYPYPTDIELENRLMLLIEEKCQIQEIK